MWSLIAIVAALLFSFSIAACPRQLALDVTGAGDFKVVVDGAPVPTIEVARAIYHTITIHNDSDDGGGVKSIIMGRPVLSTGGTLAAKDMTLSPAWQANTTDDLYTTYDRDATIRITGRLSRIKLPFLAHSHGGKVTVVCGGSSRVTDLYADPEKWITVEAATPDRRFVASIPSTAMEVTLESSDASALVTRVQLTQGPVKLLGRWHRNDLAGSFRFCPADDVPALFPYSYALKAYLYAIGCVSLVCLAAYACGHSLPVSNMRSCGLPEHIFSSVAMGFCLLTLVTTLLTFLGLTLSYSVAVAIGLCGTASAVRFAFSPAATLPGGVQDWQTTTMLFVIGAVCGGGTLSVEWLSDGWYLGESFTDTYWYINMADILTQDSTSQFLPGLWSFQRLADIAAVGISSLLSFGSPLTRYAEFAFFLEVMLPFCVFVIASRLQLDRNTCLVCCLASTVSSSYTILFQEGYIAQLLFAHFFLWSIAFSVMAFDSAAFGDKDDSTRLAVPLGVVYAACLSVYPYQFVTPLAVGLACPWFTRLKRRRYIKMLMTAALCTLLCWNAGITLVYNFRQNAEMLDTLDGLARNIIFPFYREFEFVEMCVGSKSFYHADKWLPALSAARDKEFVDSLLGCPRLWSIASLLLTLCVVSCAAAGLAMNVFAGTLARRVFGVACLLAVLLLVPLYAIGRTYPFCKQALTLATLIPVMAIIGASQLRYLPARKRIIFAAVLGIGLIAMNVRTQLISIAAYCGRCDQEVTVPMRSHRAVVNTDLVLLSESIHAPSLNESRVLLIRGFPLEYARSDKDRVLLWLLRAMFFPLRMASTGPLPMATHAYNTEASITRERETELLASGKVDYILTFDSGLLCTDPLWNEYWPVVECDLYSLYRRRHMP
jgi:hypothetical protein